MILNRKKFSALVLLICLSFSFAHFTEATLTVPAYGISSFSARFKKVLPICENGVLYVIKSGIDIVVLVPFVPKSPIIPVVKLWGPIKDSSAEGNFYWKGVCLLPPYSTPLKVDATMIQIGTTLLPVPSVIYPYIFMW